MSHKRILIVEDEYPIAKALHDGLEDEGYEPVIAGSGEEAFTKDISSFDLVILDIRLPGMDGYEVCRGIRQKDLHLPVIFLSARDDVMDRVIGLEIGADDYMVKPFSFRELLSRIKAQLRRAYGTLAPEQKASHNVTFGNISVDKKSMRVFKEGKDVYLTPIEYRILALFLENPDQVLSRDQIIDHVWGEVWSVDDTRSVNVHIRHLREKIEVDPSHPSLVMTIRGYGYRFDLKD